MIMEITSNHNTKCIENNTYILKELCISITKTYTDIKIHITIQKKLKNIMDIIEKIK